jgi:hypothetical protein
MMNAILRACARFLARPAVVDWLIRRASRTPYTPIITDDLLYMERFWLLNPYPPMSSGAKNWFPISIRLHHIHLPDQDRHLHDHPWNARTFILRGNYVEVRPVMSWLGTSFDRPISRNAGDTATLKFGECHRITQVSPGGVWTLFVTGKYRGTWGFMVDGAKVQWRQYLGLEAQP